MYLDFSIVLIDPDLFYLKFRNSLKNRNVQVVPKKKED